LTTWIQQRSWKHCRKILRYVETQFDTNPMQQSRSKWTHLKNDEEGGKYWRSNESISATNTSNPKLISGPTIVDVLSIFHIVSVFINIAILHLD
jgi:hypothetical protein